MIRKYRGEHFFYRQNQNRFADFIEYTISTSTTLTKNELQLNFLQNHRNIEKVQQVDIHLENTFNINLIQSKTLTKLFFGFAIESSEYITFIKQYKMQKVESAKEEQLKINEGIQEQEQEEQEVTGKNKTNLNQRLIASAKKNQYEEVEKCLKKKADINYEQNTKKKWTALIWACCMGHTSIVKLLLSKGAGQPYMQIKPQNRHVPIGSTKQLKTNPLHWASFKNHLEVVEILLKAGFHWQDVDCSGNNSVMLSAAGSAPEIFKAYLQYGVSLYEKNSRGHLAKDLTTQPQILKLIEKCQNARECHISKQMFKEKDIKYWCWVCNNFVNSNNFKMQWVLRDLKATEKQKIDGRCKACWQQTQDIKNKLQQSITLYNEQNLKKVISEYKTKHCQLQITFLQECLKISHKLTVQNQILNYLKSLSKVEDYKIILKSVNNIKKMLKDAQPINIDANVIQQANKNIERLNAERNLRFQIDNIDTSVATREGVAILDEVFDEASKKGVAQQYLQVADEIKSKMKRSILAQDINQQFIEYPIRPDPYPDPLVIDFKTKKPLDPETKKPTDPANLIPKKKKGKKAPVFQIPEWATDLKDMNDRIKQLQDLLTMRDQLGLSQQFCGKAQQSINLMKKQSRYRKDMDTLQTMVDEQTKKKK